LRYVQYLENPLGFIQGFIKFPNYIGKNSEDFNLIAVLLVSQALNFIDYRQKLELEDVGFLLIEEHLKKHNRLKETQTKTDDLTQEFSKEINHVTNLISRASLKLFRKFRRAVDYIDRPTWHFEKCIISSETNEDFIKRFFGDDIFLLNVPFYIANFKYGKTPDDKYCNLVSYFDLIVKRISDHFDKLMKAIANLN